MRSVLVVSAAVVLLLAPTACDRPKGSAIRPIHCQVMADPPERDDPRTPKKIISRTRFWCDDPGADRLALTMRLQKQNAKGTWVDIAKTSFTARTGQTIRTDAERYRTREITVTCATGMYRTVVTGTSVARDVTSKYDITGARASDPCRPALFM